MNDPGKGGAVTDDRGEGINFAMLYELRELLPLLLMN